MHHFASSILSFLLSPFTWILILLIIPGLIKKNKKIYRLAALFVFIIFSNQWIFDWSIQHWQAQPVPVPQLKKYSTGIVLGGFASPDADGNGFFNETSDRFIETEKMYRLGIIQHILISGGNGKTDNENFREGDWAKKQFQIMGIPDSVIFVEDRSDDTYDNAVYAKEMLDSLKLSPPYLLITSAVHIPRASLIFKNAGLLTDPFPCNYTEGRGIFKFSDIVPKASVLAGWEPLLKEVAGYTWYAVFRKNNN